VPAPGRSLADDSTYINSNLFVAYFSLNVYVGNWLKNAFALARQEGAPLTRDTSDFGWPSMYALNAVGLPFFALRSAFGAFGSGTLYSSEHPLFTAACYTGGIVWVAIVCGARLYSGVSSPADVQGGMLVGGVLVRAWLPICEDVSALLAPQPLVLGMPQWAFLLVAAAGLLLVHPFTPGDPRSWTALAYSAKAISFATAFVIGSNTCANNSWCAVSRSSWVAALSLASVAGLALRCAVGFALLFACNVGAARVAALVEAQVAALLPSKPCMPPIARNLFVFTVSGVVISLGVPTAFTAAGL
jgi:membrane-associated phospholipid phosphatase